MDATYHLNGGFKPTTKRSADLDGPDFYPTPRWATFALIDNESFSGDIWECACDDGAMAKVLEKTGNRVLSSDLYDRGYGERGHDFLTTKRQFPNIITNPPYHKRRRVRCHRAAAHNEKVRSSIAFSFPRRSESHAHYFSCSPTEPRLGLQ